MSMGAKIAATLAVVIGWVLAFGMFTFLRTFDSAVIMWIFVIVVIAFLPRETYRIFKMWKGEVDGSSDQ